MFANFRQSMTWLHTWFGLVLGYVLMVCFFFGSLSVFDREIDRWAIPETRFPAQPMPSFDAVLKPVFDRLKPHPDDMQATQQRVIGPLPHPDTMPLASLYAYTMHRDPVLAIGGEFEIPNKLKNGLDDHAHVHGWATIDPRTGQVLPEGRLKIGSEFFYVRADGSLLQGPSLQALVAAKNPALAERTTQQIRRSVAAAESIPAPFDRAIAVGHPGRERIQATIASLTQQSKDIVEAAAAIGISRLTLVQP